MAHILVTGGAGYIGSHTCKKLRAMGHTPITYDNLSRGFKKLVKWGPFVEGDLFDYDHLVSTLQEHQVEAVIHFAAFAYVGESVKNPEIYFRNNVYGSRFLFDAMLEADVKNILFSSTCAVYGQSQERLISEDHPTQPINPYGLSKLMVEEILKKHGDQGDLNYVCLRYFNGAGADPDGETGECHNPEPHIIPNLISGAFDGKPVKIFGNDYPTEDGTCVRDFIHVSDLAEAHGLAIEALLQNNLQSKIYNLGTGQGFSLLQLVRQLEKSTHKKINVEFEPRRPGDPSYLVATADKFKSELGWSLKHSSLENIFKSAIDWHKKN